MKMSNTIIQQFLEENSMMEKFTHKVKEYIKNKRFMRNARDMFIPPKDYTYSDDFEDRLLNVVTQVYIKELLNGNHIEFDTIVRENIMMNMGNSNFVPIREY